MSVQYGIISTRNWIGKANSIRHSLVLFQGLLMPVTHAINPHIALSIVLLIIHIAVYTSPQIQISLLLHVVVITLSTTIIYNYNDLRSILFLCTYFCTFLHRNWSSSDSTKVPAKLCRNSFINYDCVILWINHTIDILSIGATVQMKCTFLHGNWSNSDSTKVPAEDK